MGERKTRADADLAYQAISAQLMGWEEVDDQSEVHNEGSNYEDMSPHLPAYTSPVKNVQGTLASSNLDEKSPTSPQESSTQNNGKMDSASTEGGREIVLTKEETSLIQFAPKGKDINSNKNAIYAENEQYHQVFQKYLEQKRNLEDRMTIAANEETLMILEEKTNDKENLHEELRAIEVQLLEQLVKISSSCGQRSSDPNRKADAEKEYDTWSLMLQLLKNHGIEGLLQQEEKFQSSNVQAAWRSAPTDFFQTELFPAQMVHKALTFPLDLATSPNMPVFEASIFTLQRRYTILQWLESIYAAHFPPDAILPPFRKDIMWRNSLKINKQTKVPLSIDTSINELHPLDCQDDADLLRGVLVYLQSGQMMEAKKLCIESGQPWRAATLMGGMYHGLQHIESDEEEEEERADDMEIEEERKYTDNRAVEEVGNPQRRQWKKQCQLVSQQLEKVLQSTSQSSSPNSNSLAVVYEAALFAILARDVPRAVSNPWMRNWTSTLWIYMSALVDATCDSLLEAHAIMRLAKGKRYPYPGTTERFEESVNDYADSLSTLRNESVVLTAMATSPYESVKSEATLDPYRLCCSAIFMGQNAIIDYILQFVVPRCLPKDRTGDEFLSTHTLRFVAHFTILMQFGYGDRLLPKNREQSVHESSFHHEMMLVLRRYIESLTQQRHLPLVALYTSLLPYDDLVETYSELLSGIDDDKDRGLTLLLARENFHSGVDLAILRKVVRNSLVKKSLNNESPLKIALKQGDAQTGSFVSILSHDYKRMRSVMWFCFYPEHRLDSIIFANSLLRRLLIESLSPIKQTTSTDLSIAAEKISACKIFLSQLFPMDSRDAAEDSLMHILANNGSLSADEIELLRLTADASLNEHSALIAFLEAHTAFEDWRQVIAICQESQPSNPQITPEGRLSSWSAAEIDIARQNEIRKFNRTMAELARTAIHCTFTAQQKLMNVLYFDGGWMDPTGGTGLQIVGPSCPSEWAMAERIEEMKTLQSVLLPLTVFMLHSVLDGAASWANNFTLGASTTLDDIKKLLVDIDDLSCLEPAFWQRRALLISDMVASDESGLSKQFSSVDLANFLKCMAEAAVKLSSYLGC